MERRPHSVGERRVDSKADGPAFHPGGLPQTIYKMYSQSNFPRVKEMIGIQACVVPGLMSDSFTNLKL